ncbi:hypothetical protein ACHAXS_010526 [Conticribra weissflogii]
MHGPKLRGLGAYKLAAEAALAYDVAAMKLKSPGFPLNFRNKNCYEAARRMEMNVNGDEMEHGNPHSESTACRSNNGNGDGVRNDGQIEERDIAAEGALVLDDIHKEANNQQHANKSNSESIDCRSNNRNGVRDDGHIGEVVTMAEGALVLDNIHKESNDQQLANNSNCDSTNCRSNNSDEGCGQIEEVDTARVGPPASDGIHKEANDRKLTDQSAIPPRAHRPDSPSNLADEPNSMRPSTTSVTESDNCKTYQSEIALRDDSKSSRPLDGGTSQSPIDVIDLCDSDREENDDAFADATQVNSEQSTAKIKNGEANSAWYTPQLSEQELYRRKVKQNLMMKLTASQITAIKFPYPEGTLVWWIDKSLKRLTKSEKMMLKLRAMESHYAKLHLGRDFDDVYVGRMTPRANHVSIIEGRVVAVWMDLDQFGNVCEIEVRQSMTPESNHPSKQCLFIREKNLHFAPSCEISIQHTHDNWCPGRVVFCNVNPKNNEIFYTVQAYRNDGEFQLIKDVDSSRIKYRNLNEIATAVTTTAATNASKSFDTEHFKYKESAPSTATGKVCIAEYGNIDNNIDSQQNVTSDNTTSILSNVKGDSKTSDKITEDNKDIPIRVMCDSNETDKNDRDNKFISNDNDNNEEVLSDLTYENRQTLPSAPHKAEDVNSSNDKPVGCETDSKKRARSPSPLRFADQPPLKQTRVSPSNKGARKIICRINFPKWLVRDSEASDRLVYAMSDSRNGISFLDTICRDSNCIVRLQTNNSESFCRKYDRNYVEILSNGGSDPLAGGRIAKERIENFLLDYFRHDGSQGRMFYNIGKGAKQFHPRSRGLYGTMYQRDPFSRLREFGWISIVEIPCEGNPHSGRKRFHGDFLIDRKHYLKSRLRKELDCSLKFCGEEVGGIRVRYGDPYVWVFGGRAEDVDEAVGIIKDEIRRHMAGCRCN